MALTITNPTLSNPANKSQIEANFTDVTAKFNAGITTADISSTAGITNAQLANSIYEVVVNLTCGAEGWQAGTAAGDLLALAAIPGTSGSDGTYTGIAYSWACTDCGAQTGQFRVEWGYFDATGVWTVVSTPIAATTLTALSATNETPGAGGATFTTAFTLATDFTAANQGPRFFALVMATDDATAMSTAGGAIHPSILTVTLKLKRTSGLRT